MNIFLNIYEMQTKKNYDKMVCSNYKRGHIYRICKEPKTSLGIMHINFVTINYLIC